MDQAIDFCLRAGGTAIHCMAGRVAPEDRAVARAVFLDNLRAASAKAAPHGLTLLLEPLNPRDAPGYFYATAAEGASVIAEAGCPNLKLMFDCYHVGVTGDDVIAELDRLFALVGHIQIAAVPSRAEPDGGRLDYRTVFAAIERLGYGGWIGCEYKPAASTDAGLTWAERLGVSI